MSSNQSAGSTFHSSSLEINPQFLTTAAQELNNPITTIKTALTLLSSSKLSPKQRDCYLQMIGQACDRQSNLINDVFELLELQLTPPEKTLEKVQLWELLPGVVSTYQPIAEENNIVLTYTASPHLPPVLAIEAYLKQALISLLSGSIELSNREGKIWVTAHHRVDGKVALVLQNHGQAISRAKLSRRLDSLDRHQVEGSGLGLTVVQQLLAHCGASLSVSSLLHDGITYTILLATASESSI